jgi:hypothetical protein
MTLDSTDQGFQGCGGLQRHAEFLTDLLLLGPAAVVNILRCEYMDSLTLCDCWLRPAARHLTESNRGAAADGPVAALMSPHLPGAPSGFGIVCY